MNIDKSSTFLSEAGLPIKVVASKKEKKKLNKNNRGDTVEKSGNENQQRSIGYTFKR
jgi:hypothetical protein